MSSEAADIYVWSPLEDPSQQLRLFELEAPDDDGTIRCSLRHVGLDVEGGYQAVSYACGDLTRTQPIFIDGKKAQIPLSLAAALRHFSGTVQGPIWADAISINQADAVEKSTQVGLMSVIYQRARNVLVWLGENDHDDSIYALALLESAGKATPLSSRLLQTDELFSRRGVDATSDLMKRTWWHRLWTKQEILLARSSTIHCGKHSFSSDHIFHVLVKLLLYSSQEESLQLGSEFVPIFHAVAQSIRQRFMRTLRAGPQGSAVSNDIFSSATRLLTLMQDFDSLKYTDPRDQVFAVLGLASDELVQYNPPDYQMSLRQVHTRLTETWISSKGNLDILNLCWNTTVTPSWVPVFNEPGNPCIIASSIASESPIYHASSQSQPEVLLTDGDPDHRKEIRISGFCIDLVNFHTDKIPGFIDDITPTTPEVRHWRELAASVSVDEESFWMTMNLDQNRQARRRTPEERDEFRNDVRQWLQSDNTEWPSEDFRSQVKRGLYAHLFTTSRNRLGFCWTRAMLRADDKVCILFGGQTPFILRECADGSHVLAGECYVDGLMNGEAMVEYEAGKFEKTVFRII